MWEKQLLRFLPHPVKQEKFIMQIKTIEMTEEKDLTKEESKSRYTQSSDQKRDETRNFAAVW